MVPRYVTVTSSRRVVLCLLVIGLSLTGCATSTVAGNGSGTQASTPTPPTPSPTPVPACVTLVPNATPVTSVNNVPGIQLPAGTYSTPATSSGGGAGQYTIATYNVCYAGTEATVDGSPSSTLSMLEQNGWVVNNLFPDPSSFTYLDYCSAGGGSGHSCVNTSGVGTPFTFVSFDKFASHSGGYTTFRLQVATIGAPTCVNDPQYYSGTPKYTLYEDGSTASSSNPTYHFLMPPATRVSTFQGGGTAGSTYTYFCSAGSQSTVVNFLVQAMQNVGWTISSAASAGFSASMGSGPTYRIDVSVSNPNNYYLRIFVPM
jgi:hypothetical protein